ncbi:MAG TPA: VTT domain-containing protein [Thermoleophilaceae bacterium]
MPLRRLVAAVPMILLIGAAWLWLPHAPSELRDLTLSAGMAGPAVALAAWVVLTPALFPGPVLAASAGLAFGAVGGTALACAGAVLGGVATFALARAVLRGPVTRYARRSARLARVNALLETQGFAAVLAARMMPGVPATGLYYAAGASPVRLRAFAPAIAVGALLRTTPYALLGHGLASGSAVSIGIAAASIALGGAGALLLARRLRSLTGMPLPAPAARP